MQLSLLMFWYLPHPWWVRATDTKLLPGNHSMGKLAAGPKFLQHNSQWVKVMCSLWAEVAMNTQVLNLGVGAESKHRLLYKNEFVVRLQPPSPVMMARRAPSSQLSPPTSPGKEMWLKFTESFNPHYNAWTSQNSWPRAEFGLHQLKGVLLRAQEKTDHKSKVQNHRVSVVFSWWKGISTATPPPALPFMMRSESSST